MPRKVRERTRRDLTSESGPAGPALDPRTGGGAVRAHPAVGEPPATAGAADELVPVAAPVVNPAVGDGEEVAAGAGAIGPVQLDQHVGDVVADAGRPGPGGEVAAGAGHELPNRAPPSVGWLALDLEHPVLVEQADQVVEAAAVDAVGVAGDRVADLLASFELPRVHRDQPRAAERHHARTRR